MEAADMQLYWGAEGLVAYPWNLMSHVPVPKSSLLFLERTGLPKIEDVRFRFEPCKIPFVEIDPALHFRIVGVYDSSFICIEDDTGAVYWYDEEGPATRFVNSSIESFALCITIHHRMLMECRAVDDSQYGRLVSRASDEMKVADPGAFTSQEFYWSIVFEEIGYELD